MLVVLEDGPRDVIRLYHSKVIPRRWHWLITLSLVVVSWLFIVLCDVDRFIAFKALQEDLLCAIGLVMLFDPCLQ